MMKKSSIFILVIVFMLGLAPLYAQRVIRIASMVPENTAWGQALNRLAAEWTQVTNREVTFQIFHNGVAGGELDVLRKLRLNEIQGAVFSTVGLSAIAQEIMTISVPFMIRTDAELDIVLASAKDDLERIMSSKGFQVLAWARAGWVRFFSKSPILTPSDLTRMKLGTIPGQAELTQALRAMGYQTINVADADIIISLNSGMIDAVYDSPLLAAANQIFGVARNMLNLNIAPVMGGLVMNQPGWRAIPERYRARILEISKRVEREMDLSIIALETEALETMRRYGLQINTPSASQIQLWYNESDRAIPGLLGTTFNRDLYNRFTTILRNYRNGR
ncbi:MAG: TRAP transporter substrate-binding protein DctP [Treponema sp.]|jgi:TRAP-type C4-dicarboxylate transport system substrate-binding protein|nr:TRAP transporter substrate-binding protein DctP [Treponema sp.]